MPSKTDEVLAAARGDLEAQLATVREEIARLAVEEQALAHAVAGLDGGNPATSSGSSVGESARRSRSVKSRRAKGSTGKASSGRRRAARGTSRSTAERVDELRGLLAEGPQSRSALAAALGVSPALRVQQLLGELGSSVSSQPDPDQRRGKLWSLKDAVSGAGGAKPAAKRGSRAAKRGARSKAAAPKPSSGLAARTCPGSVARSHQATGHGAVGR